MAWVVGRKSDESLVEITGKKDPDFLLSELEINIPINNGGVFSDYSYFPITNETLVRIRNEDDYVLTWTSNEITGVDFTEENNKRWLKVFTDKTNILNDGTDTAALRFEVWRANLTGIAAAVNVTDVRVPIVTPYGERTVRVDVVNGVVNLSFATTVSGTWKFVANLKRFANMRVFNRVSIEVDDGDVF